MAATRTRPSFPSLDLDRPEDGILRLTLRAPGRLNAVSEAQHGELARVWQAIGQDAETRAVLVRGADGAFSSGGDLDLVLAIADDADTRQRVFHEARDLVYNMLRLPDADRLRDHRPGRRRRARRRPARGRLAREPEGADRRRPHEARRRGGRPRGDRLAAPVRDGEGEVPLLLCEEVDGAEAERIGLVSLCVPEEELEERALEIARRLAAGSRSAISHTKLRSTSGCQTAGPIFDASLELEFLDMTGPDVREGVAAVREKRPPRFS